MKNSIEPVDGKCPCCDRPMGLIPSENWAPYKWLWQHTCGEPYTWVMRRHPAGFLTFLIPYLVAVSVWSARRWWTIVLAFSAGFMTGHVYW